jgi:CHAD domain
VKPRQVKKLDPSASLAENAARIVRVRLDELRSFAPPALEGREIQAQHDMRIAAKRLRYVLEATEFCLGRPAETARRRARDLQDVLGEMHDCDVMLPRVEEHVARLRADDARAVRERAGDAPDLDPRLAGRSPNRTSYRGLEILAVYLEARRELLYDRFRELWIKQERRGTWRRLDRAARERIKSSRALRRAERRPARAHRELEDAEAAKRHAQDRARRAATPTS